MQMASEEESLEQRSQRVLDESWAARSGEQVGQWVKIDRIDGGMIYGMLFTIDPETNAAFLLRYPEVETNGERDVANSLTSDGGRSSASGRTDRMINSPVASPENEMLLPFDLYIVTGHSIKSIEPDPEGGTAEAAAALEEMAITILAPQSLSRTDLCNNDPAAIAKQREWMVSTLVEHRVPYEEHSDNVVLLGGVATVGPPYTAASVRSSNAVVLRRLQTLLSNEKVLPIDE